MTLSHASKYKIDTNPLLVGGNMAELYHQSFLVFYIHPGSMGSSTSKYVVSSFGFSQNPLNSPTVVFEWNVASI